MIEPDTWKKTIFTEIGGYFWKISVGSGGHKWTKQTQVNVGGKVLDMYGIFLTKFEA